MKPCFGVSNPLGMEFHVSRDARDRYQFDESLFSITGNVIFANFRAARIFAQKINQRRDLVNFPEQAVQASQINAMGLIHEITHYVFRAYREQQNPRLLDEALEWLNSNLGPEGVDAALLKFVDEFPPLAVYRRDQTRDAYIEDQTDGLPNRQVVLEEMLMLWLSNTNPAFGPYLELFDDDRLEKQTPYPSIMSSLYTFFGTQPMIGELAGIDDNSVRAGIASGQNLIDILRAPMRAAPHSLEAQLRFLQERWGIVLGRYIYRLFGSLDLIKEEEKQIFFGPGPIALPAFDAATLGQEPERFSHDRDWMPRLVMIAKNAFVWLDQLAKRYQRPIASLADIPDAELDTLAQRGITGLWLIGLWERSPASQRIKQIMGNPDAVASAYSLFDYQIAHKLGGEPACANLRDRAWQRGIRLASDMVPNHVGIDGRWVIEHPDWFIRLDEPPFPAYTFTGPDLSADARAGIFLEDHYYDRSDAAVVFQRVDRASGQAQYLYHGNDGTSFPWNDTAQLNYLNPAVREGVIQTILHVARQFPIIRFDAAMTLAKRHFQRLWFPEPGSGGDIASRAEFGLTKAQFDAAFPEEFWRAVVDRVAAAAPDTLLLAEAFWMMEGYFVRTLGMHRVYNSAFMVLLRDEDNAKYRQLMKQTLEFDPQILKRYVNFQNNPDERTAVEQFGTGDKYFGVCTLLATLPGLPMFGHGQFEGFTEKYGMEYQRAYWDEQPDAGLLARHDREIVPLLHRREVFAEVADFLLYDFYAVAGGVNEDVFAYSNRAGAARALVVYHNTYAETRGWIRLSAAYVVKTGPDERTLVQKTLGEGLGLHVDGDHFCILRDHVRGLEYLHSSQELHAQGMYIELGAYKCHVFVDIREVQDNAWGQYRELARYLGGRGVPSVDEALRELVLQPVLTPFKGLVTATTFRRLYAARVLAAGGQPDDTLLDELAQQTAGLLAAIQGFTGSAGDAAPVVAATRRALAAVLQIPALDQRPTGQLVGDGATAVAHASAPAPPRPAGAAAPPARTESAEPAADPAARAPGDAAAASAELWARLDDDLALWARVFSWVFVHALGRLRDPQDGGEQSRGWIEEWQLGRVIAGALEEVGLDPAAAARAVIILKRLTSHQRWFAAHGSEHSYQVLNSLLRDTEMQQLLGVNRHQGILWFDKPAFERLLWWLLLLAVVMIRADESRSVEAMDEEIAACYRTIERLRTAAAQAGYQVEKLLEAARAPVA